MRLKIWFRVLLLLVLSTVPVYPSSIAGIWDFELEITHMVGSDGFVAKEKRTFNWVVRFKQNGETLKGDLIGGKGSRGETVCADASIEGTMKGRKIEFIVEYQGVCCKNGQVKFVGYLDADEKTIDGNFEPVDIPPSSCRLAYAVGTASKREGLRSLP